MLNNRRMLNTKILKNKMNNVFIKNNVVLLQIEMCAYTGRSTYFDFEKSRVKEFRSDPRENISVFRREQKRRRKKNQKK
jgi:hypothetical protein